MAGLLGNYAPGLLGGMQDQMPPVPFRQNPVVSAIGAGLLQGPNMAGRYDFSAVGPAIATKGLMQQKAADKQAAEAQKAQISEAWKSVMLAKSQGQPPPPEAMSVIAQSNPSIAAKYFEGMLPGSGPKASLVPIWGEDENGNPALVQPTDQGTAIQTQLPPGFKPSKGIDRVDAGTEWILLDKQTGAVVGRQPKDLAGAEREKEIGKQQGEAISDLPTAIGKADAALKTIDQLRNHPGRKGGVGMSAWQTWVPGSPEYDFSVQLKQAQGQVFLSAYQDLKGGGQITEIEGQKAEQAIARLDNWQSEEAFESALNDLEEVIRNGLKRAQQRARGEVPEVPASVNTQPPAGVDPEAWKYMTPEERALWN